MRSQRFLRSQSLFAAAPKANARANPTVVLLRCLSPQSCLYILALAAFRNNSKSQRFFTASSFLRNAAPDNASYLSVIGSRGSYKLAVPLPAKGVQVFSLPNEREQLRAFLADIVLEDPSISAIAAYDESGTRIAGSTHGRDLLRGDWKLSINGKPYLVKAPVRTATGSVIQGVQESAAYQSMLTWVAEQRKARESLPVSEFISKAQDLGVTPAQAKQFLVAMNNSGVVLYFDSNIELSEKVFLTSTSIQRSVENFLDLPHIALTQSDRIALVAKLREQLQPLAELRASLEDQAERSTQIMVWSLFGLLGAQFVLFARLTWWESSWDVMEPVTYFVSFAETALAGYFWYLFTGQEYVHMGLREIYYNWRLKKISAKNNFDDKAYEALKKRIADLDHEIQQFADDVTLKK